MLFHCGTCKVFHQLSFKSANGNVWLEKEVVLKLICPHAFRWMGLFVWKDNLKHFEFFCFKLILPHWNSVALPCNSKLFFYRYDLFINISEEQDVMLLIGIGVACACAIIIIGIMCWCLYKKGYCASKSYENREINLYSWYLRVGYDRDVSLRC